MSNKLKLLLLGGLLAGITLTGFHLDSSYRFPIDTYRALSGTFGELRSDHFHSGIDVKTGGKSGAPLYAIEDGYVYRVKVSSFGFGRAIYLRHPDGKFSVYAHMSRFNKKLEQFAYDRQYASRQYAQEIYLDKDEIPVKKGDLIGYSGNSGSSLGPHLHFEIRDPQENILNPLHYYPNTISDTKKPILMNIAVDPLETQSRVRGQFAKYKVRPSGSAGRYRVDQVIKVYGKVGLEYQAYDLLNAAGNHCGINYAGLYLDGKLIYEFNLDRFSFDEKRYINLHIDYPDYKKNRQRFQRAYVEKGNHFSAYRGEEGSGAIELTDDAIHHFRLVLTDGNQNTSILTGRMQRDARPNRFSSNPTYYSTPVVRHEIRRNTLILRAKQAHRTYRDGIGYENILGEAKKLMPAYMVGNEMVFLLPLTQNDYPRRIFDQVGKLDMEMNLQEEILSTQNNLVEMDELQLFFPYQSVFDRVHLNVSRKNGNPEVMYSDIFDVGDANIPLFKSFLVSFKPSEPQTLTHMVVAHKSRGRWKFAGNTIGDEGNVYASVRSFGEYCLMADSIAPEVSPVNFGNGGRVSSSQSTLSIRIKDSFSGIDHEKINCTLNGEWKLFFYDYKRNVIVHDLRKQKRPAPGTYTLKVSVEDKARNVTTKSYRLTF